MNPLPPGPFNLPPGCDMDDIDPPKASELCPDCGRYLLGSKPFCWHCHYSEKPDSDSSKELPSEATTETEKDTNDKRD